MNSPTVHVPPAGAPVREDWLAKYREEILEPDLPIIDPHHHLWQRLGWPYLLDELLADTTSGHNVVATVFVQCRAMYRADGPAHMRPLGEVEFVNGIAAMSASGIYAKSRLCAGIAGHADLTLGARVREVLEAEIALGGGRFKGIRHITAHDDDPEVGNPNYRPGPQLMADKTFREGFAQLGKLGLTYDAWLYHPQIDELTDLARAFPDQKIVLDHCGGPVRINAYAKDPDLFAKWSKSVKALAGCPNVYVKLGGLGMHINGFHFEDAAVPPSSEALAAAWKPYIDTCIEAFGARRCMFESNFPVDKVSGSYATYFNAFKRLASGTSAEEKAALFAGTAAEFYSLDLPALLKLGRS